MDLSHTNIGSCRLRVFKLLIVPSEVRPGGNTLSPLLYFLPTSSLIVSCLCHVWRICGQILQHDKFSIFTLLDRRHTVRLHAQLSRITAIVRPCCSIRQLQLSEYTCRWEDRITGWSMSHPGMIGGAVTIETPPADLFTSPAASAFEKDAVRRARRSYIFVHFVCGVHDNYTN